MGGLRPRAHGRTPETPVALVHRGTTAAQEVLVGTLVDIVGRARAAALAPPVVIVVGEVVALRDRLAWFAGDADAFQPAAEPA